MCEHAMLNVALQIQPVRPRPPGQVPPPPTPEWPGSKESRKTLATRETGISAGRCGGRIQSGCAVPSPVPPLPSPPPQPICRSTSTSSSSSSSLQAPRHRWGCWGRSGALLTDALARAAHFAVQLHHLEDGFLAAAAQMVEQAVVLLG